jgi:hypothetical protein
MMMQGLAAPPRLPKNGPRISGPFVIGWTFSEHYKPRRLCDKLAEPAILHH